VRKPLWRCPSCGHEFVSRNATHSCRNYDLEDRFRRKPLRIRQLYEAFVALVRGCGPVKIEPKRDGIALQVRVRFAGVQPRQKGIRCGLWLTRKVPDAPHLVRIETWMPHAHGHYFWIENAEQLCDLVPLIREAYAIGEQKHLKPRRREGGRS